MPKVSEWIKCSERMPSLHKPGRKTDVLCYLKHLTSGNSFNIICQGYYDGQLWIVLAIDNNYDFSFDERLVCESYQVTHWMPLPEPPQD